MSTPKQRLVEVDWDADAQEWTVSYRASEQEDWHSYTTYRDQLQYSLEQATSNIEARMGDYESARDE